MSRSDNMPMRRCFGPSTTSAPILWLARIAIASSSVAAGSVVTTFLPLLDRIAFTVMIASLGRHCRSPGVPTSTRNLHGATELCRAVACRSYASVVVLLGTDQTGLPGFARCGIREPALRLRNRIIHEIVLRARTLTLRIG